MCLSVNVGRVDVSIYFQINDFKDTIPQKEDADGVTRELHNQMEELVSIGGKMQDLLEDEEKAYIDNIRLDKRIINLTILESAIIIALFLLEYVIFQNYLKQKAIF